MPREDDQPQHWLQTTPVPRGWDAALPQPGAMEQMELALREQIRQQRHREEVARLVMAATPLTTVPLPRGLEQMMQVVESQYAPRPNIPPLPTPRTSAETNERRLQIANKALRDISYILRNYYSDQTHWEKQMAQIVFDALTISDPPVR